ncbi:MAG TPA: arginine repressor [Thermoanaerobaculia bacterium]|nr:arginine repressor [Thermoanaerobaculia bacterium]
MPLDREHQDRRRKATVEILRDTKVGSQQELADLLRKKGIEATQSSVSRDLQDLGAVRVDGVYELPALAPPPDSEFERVREFIRTVQTVGQHRALVTTDAGAARIVARAVDLEKWPEVVGTVSGEDSFVILTKDIVFLKLLLLRFKKFMTNY